MITIAKFDFLPDTPIFVAELYQKEEQIILKFAMQFLKGTLDNVARSILNSIDNGEFFFMDLYHDDGIGERYEKCFIKGAKFSLSVQESLDIEIIIEAHRQENRVISLYEEGPIPRMIISSDCNIDIVSTKGVRVPKKIYKATFDRWYEKSVMKGTLFAYNMTLDQNGPSFIDVINEEKEFSLRFGFKIDGAYEDLFFIDKTEIHLSHRSVKDGLDKVEVVFDTSKYV